MARIITITKGAVDWQIYQQKNGFADINLEGSFIQPDEQENKVWVRLVCENTQMSVIEWFHADITENGCFTAKIKGVPAGGLYRIETSLNPYLGGVEWGYQGDSIFHIGVGDLFVIAGQSNSSGYGRTPVVDPPDPYIHLFRNRENWDMATHPMNDSTCTAHEINSEVRISGHSPYLSFAKTIRQHLHYPIGLIQTAKGGSALSSWNPFESAELYNNMIDVVKKSTNQKGTIAGVLWYQGCSDCTEKLSKTYLERFTNMVRSIRKELNDEDLPIFTVQLNKTIPEASNMNNGRFWSIIRENQRQAAEKIPFVFVVPTIDLGLSDGIHNSSASNMVIGERLGRMVLREIHHKKVYGKAPNIKSASLVGKNKIAIEFENVYLTINTLGLLPQDMQFEAFDENGELIISDIAVDKNIVFLWLSEECGKECFVSFAAKLTPHSNIPYDMGSGLPLLSFYRYKIEG